MRARLFWLALFTALILLAGCSSEPKVLGDSSQEGGNVQKVKIGTLHLTFTRYLDAVIQIEIPFNTRLNTSPREGYVALVSHTEFGKYYILVHEGLYKDVISGLRKDDRIRVFGRVGTAKLPTDDVPRVALYVDQ